MCGSEKALNRIQHWQIHRRFGSAVRAKSPYCVLCAVLCAVLCVCCVYPILCSFCFFPWVRPSYIIQFHFSLHTVFALTRSNLSAALKTQHQNTTETKHFFEKKTNNTTSTTVTSNQQQQPTKKKKIIRLNFHQ